MRENQRHTVPAFLLECFVLQHLILKSEEWIAFTTIQKWHYRLLRNFNLITNDKGVILIRLYFRL